MNYLKFNQIDLSNYRKEVAELIDKFIKEIDNNINFRKCKKCGKYYPASTIFFSYEKRIKDGFENSCRCCRGKKFLKVSIDNHNKKVTSFHYNKFDVMNDSDIIKLYEIYLNDDILPYQDFMVTNYKFLIKYVIEDKLKMSNKDILNISRDWTKQYKFYSVLLRKYNGSVYNLINDFYPNKFKPWDLVTVGNLYWKSEDNIKYALNWFVNELLKDSVVKSIEDIPKKITTEIFAKYSMKGLLKSRFNSHPYYAFNFLFPDKFYMWEYKLVSNNYWNDKMNRVDALKQLIKYRLHIERKNIHKVLSLEYFQMSYKYHKFISVIENHYDLDCKKYIIDAYPKYNDNLFYYKNYYPTLDNIYVRSEPERLLHHIFIYNFNYEQIKYEYSFIHDFKRDLNYIPDWTYFNNGITYLIEYYGFLGNNYNNFADDIGYVDKYKNKHEYYLDLVKKNDNIKYIDLYRSDLKDNYSGLIKKFKESNIILDVDIDYRILQDNFK